jgi:hypothetical protein
MFAMMGMGNGLGRRTLEDPDSGGEVVDAAGSAQGSGEDLDGGDEVVGEAVVKVALRRESVLVLYCRVWISYDDDTVKINR